MNKSTVLSSLCQIAALNGDWEKMVRIKPPFLLMPFSKNMVETWAIDKKVKIDLGGRSCILVEEESAEYSFSKEQPMMLASYKEYQMEMGFAILCYCRKLFGEDMGKALFQTVLTAKGRIIIQNDVNGIKAYENWFEFFSEADQTMMFSNNSIKNDLGLVVCPEAYSDKSVQPKRLSQTNCYLEGEMHMSLHSSGRNYSHAEMMGHVADPMCVSIEYDDAALLLTALHNCKYPKPSFGAGEQMFKEVQMFVAAREASF